MNPDFDPESRPELARLASRLLDGDASPGEIAELGRLLEDDPEAHAFFVRFSELHAMLESEPTILAALRDDFLPENVVSLDADGASATGAPSGSAPSPATAPKPRPTYAPWLAAAAGIAFLVVTWPSFPWNRDPAGVTAGAASEPAKRPADVGDSADPLLASATEEQSDRPAGSTGTTDSPEGDADADSRELQYERAVLASLGSGSQQRPPTNFTSEPSAAGEKLSYNRDIRPILSDNCFSCHGPDEKARKAKLRLDTREGATGGESPAIVAGAPEASEFVARLTAEDQDDLMPPADSHKTLTPDQIALLTRWVTEGAEWEEHWSFRPIENPLPEDAEGHPVDYFVDRRLESLGLSRSPEADRATLVRRATLDITGLPPTPDEVEAFLADDRPDAWERLVDGLLDRPTFGEHRARYWLDAARYGDTHGLHLDNYREMWPYRDWVIDAFNSNLPFDRFTIDQIAGDLLPDATPQQQVATGFNRCNVTTSEGGAIAEEFLVRYGVDRVTTTATVWMGMTALCAQCHDHKFDPMTMKDFYSLFAFFNNTTQPGMDGNAKDSPPVIRVYDSAEQQAEADRLARELAEAQKAAQALLPKPPKVEVGDGTIVPIPAEPEVVVDAVAPAFCHHGNAEKPTSLGKAASFGVDKPFTVSLSFKLPDQDGRTLLASHTDAANADRGWRIFWENRGIVVELIESYPDRILKRGITRRFKPGAAGHVAFSYDGSGHSDGIHLYYKGDLQGSRFINQWFDSLTGDFASESAELLVGGKDPESGLVPEVNEFAFFDRRLADHEVKVLSTYSAAKNIQKKPLPQRKEAEAETVRRFLALFSEGPYRDAMLRVAEAESKLRRIESSTPITLVMADKDGEAMAHILERGEYDKQGEQVGPAFPEFLPGIGEDLPPTRLGLAQWLVHPDHPLTARVTVNRIWQELFGIGLVKTSEDFGTQGENPSHPRLLDYLAASFVADGWDVKALYRTLLTSETYRQSSNVSEELAKLDPENRLLARGPRFRLDAEVIRDQALLASGLLEDTVGGPSVRPYQPGGIWEAVGYTNSNTQTFFQDYGASAEHRRSIYTFWKRTAHPPNLAIFDAPNRESCVMRRERTNTPLQALVLMNDPQFVRAARFLALRVLEEADGRDERLDLMARHLRGRPLDEEERQVVVNSLDQFANIYGSDEPAAESLLRDEVNPGFSLEATAKRPATELATWTMIASQMMNLDEVLNKN